MTEPTPNHLPTPGDAGALARLRGMLEAARAVRAGGDLQPLLEAIARAISVSLGFATVAINLHRPAWDDFEVAVVRGSEAARRVLLGTTRSWDGWQTLLDPRFEHSGCFLVPHDEFEWDADGLVSYVPPENAPSAPEDWHPEDALFVPLRSSTGRLLGVASVDEPIDGRRPSDAQLEVLSAVCGYAALAVEHAQAAAEADRDRAAVQHLLRVSARLTGRRTVQEMLAAVCGGIREALGFQRVIVALTEGPDHRLMIRSSVGWSRDELAALPDVPLSSISRLLRPEHQREGCVLLTREEAEVLTPPDLHDVHRGRRNGRGPLAWRNHWLIVPLHDRDGAFTGIVWVDEPEDRLIPTTEGLQALRAFANQAISAVESTHTIPVKAPSRSCSGTSSQWSRQASGPRPLRVPRGTSRTSGGVSGSASSGASSTQPSRWCSGRSRREIADSGSGGRAPSSSRRQPMLDRVTRRWSGPSVSATITRWNPSASRIPPQTANSISSTVRRPVRRAETRSRCWTAARSRSASSVAWACSTASAACPQTAARTSSCASDGRRPSIGSSTDTRPSRRPVAARSGTMRASSGSHSTARRSGRPRRPAAAGAGGT